MKKRWIVGGVLVGLLGISGTGIAVNSQWLGGRWDASHATTDLANTLQKLDGVAVAEATYSPLALPDATVAVSVTFTSNSAPEAWQRADELIRSAASQRALRSTTTTATFAQAGDKGSATVNPLVFTPAQVRKEVAAWRALQATVGNQVSLYLDHDARGYSVKSAHDMLEIASRWTADIAAPDDSLTTSWTAPGMQLAHLPTPSEMASLSAIGRLLPLAPVAARPNSRGNYAVILGDLRGYKVEFLTLRGNSYGAATLDTKLVQATDAALSNGAPVVEWMSSDRDPSLISGECGTYQVDGRTFTTTFQNGADSMWFETELAGMGFAIPAGVRAGTCQVAAK
ncbi:MAG: hypothetical protein ABIP33_10915 [Pseudolysinimonas sp.]